MSRFGADTVGRAGSPIPWEALVRIFDTIWGPDAHRLGGYPLRVGNIRAFWEDAAGTEHNAALLEDIRAPYEREETSRIVFTGRVGYGPGGVFAYAPADAAAQVLIQASDEGIVEAAHYWRNVLKARLDAAVSVFVAKRGGLTPGDDWSRVIRDQLLNAEMLIALCSTASKSSPWVFWESGAVWGRGKPVVPLFLRISANDFNGPITLYCQGGSFFDIGDMNQALQTVVGQVCPGLPCPDLTTEEVEELQRLEGEYR